MFSGTVTKQFLILQLNHDEDKTREEILSLIAHHVTAVNYIYRDTKFDGKVEHRNIKFEVQRIKVIKIFLLLISLLYSRYTRLLLCLLRFLNVSLLNKSYVWLIIHLKKFLEKKFER